MIATSALQSGLTVALMKLCTELGQSNEFWPNPGFAFGLAWGVGSSGAIQIHMLNQAMKYYDQMEAIPIY